MKALRLEEPGRLQTVQLDAPGEPGSGEALVGVHRVGICGTDLHAYRGEQTFFDYPRILGHELGVEILEVRGDAGGLRAGDHCAVEPYLNCGDCTTCRAGKTNCCVNLSVLGVHQDGGMCDWLIVPAAKLHVSRELSLDRLALVEPLSVSAHAVGRGRLARGESVLVIGTGPIGLGVIEFAAVAGARVMALETRPSRLEFCRRFSRAESCLEADGDPLSRIREALEGELPSAVFDCTGNPSSMVNAFQLVSHGGRLVFVGHFPGDVTFHDPLFHGREMTLLATRNATGDDFQHVIARLEDGTIDVTPWVTHRVSAGEAAESFPGWLDPEGSAIKPLLEWS